MIETVSKRILRKLVACFPIGARVRLTAEAARMFPKYADREATIVGYFHKVAPKLLWDGRKTADSYSTDFLRVIRRTPSKAPPAVTP